MAALSSHFHGLLSDKVRSTFFSTSISATGRLGRLADSASGNSIVRYVIYSSLTIPLVFPFYRYILNDYEAFLALGPGGTPSTFNGYLWVTFLKVFFARSDTCVPPGLTPGESPTKGHLQSLPQRSGQRPQVAGIAPHRQLTQKGSVAMQEALAVAIHKVQAANKSILSTGTSCFEKHNLALFFSPRPVQPPNSSSTISEFIAPALAHPRSTTISARNPMKQLAQTCDHHTTTINTSDAMNATCGHPAEVVHLHTTDGSIHLTLHPLDAALVINNGWGERHPLAGRGPWVPKGFVMAYAPRTVDEVEVLMDIVRAGAWWVGGIDLKKGRAADVETVSGKEMSAV